MKVTTKYSKIRLEASPACQLKCPSCPTADKTILPTIGKGFLRANSFRQLLDENSDIKEIELSNYGEIFLNPELLEILKYAHEKKVILTAHNGVNLNNVKEEVLEGLVKYQFRKMSCSIDGTSPKAYEQYRVEGNYETVINNIEKINHFKKIYASKYPVMTWQFILFGHNEHQLQEAKKLAKYLNMSFNPKLSWDSDFSPWSDEVARKEFGIASREDYKKRQGADYAQGICHQLWDCPQINWDGKVLGCCRNFWGDFGGNVFEDGFLEALNHEKLSYAKAMLLGINAQREDIPCSSCDIYLTMKRNKKWLDRSLKKRFTILLRKSAPPSLKSIIKRIRNLIR